MEPYRFEDVLTGASVACDYPGLDARISHGDSLAGACSSVFFPGCSLLNYGLPLVQSVYDLLHGAGEVQGTSLLCCGKILSYEPDGDRVRAEFEAQLVERVAQCGIERIVTACPNCTKALRGAFAADERTAQVKVEPLPAVLARLGYRIDADTARSMLGVELGEGADVSDAKFCPHDSCPDRETGEFADGLRALLPANITVEAAHNRKRSQCCGSLVRAAGKYEAADKQALRRAEEADEAQASALVTACVSCSFQLTAAQKKMPVFHYLELLYNWRIPWPYLDGYMKLRFLFDESLGAVEDGSSNRSFVGLGA